MWGEKTLSLTDIQVYRGICGACGKPKYVLDFDPGNDNAYSVCEGCLYIVFKREQLKEIERVRKEKEA